MSDTPASALETFWKNPFLRIPVMLCLSAGTVVAIAGGFYVAYRVVTWIGN